MLSGLLIGIAVVFTPPTLWVGVALPLYFFFRPQNRRETVWFVGAASLPPAITAVLLALRGSLAPMLTSFPMGRRTADGYARI
jgi:hypothetical protein